MEDKKRIEAILTHLKLSKNKLGVLIGDKNGMRFQNVESGRNGISEKLAKDIVAVFPQLNYEWILNGSGEMLNSNEPRARQQSDRISADVEDLIKERAERIKDLKYTIELQRDKIKLLEDQIKVCEEKSEKVSTRAKS